MQSAEPIVRNAPPRELLLATHSFPGTYCVKAFGPGDEVFRRDVEAIAADTVVSFTASVRSTASGSSSCVTLDLHVRNVDEIIAVYERLCALPKLKLIL